jgi:hypothetical protein
MENLQITFQVYFIPDRKPLIINQTPHTPKPTPKHPPNTTPPKNEKRNTLLVRRG